MAFGRGKGREHAAYSNSGRMWTTGGSDCAKLGWGGGPVYLSHLVLLTSPQQGLNVFLQWGYSLATERNQRAPAGAGFQRDNPSGKPAHSLHEEMWCVPPRGGLGPRVHLPLRYSGRRRPSAVCVLTGVPVCRCLNKQHWVERSWGWGKGCSLRIWLLMGAQFIIS